MLRAEHKKGIYLMEILAVIFAVLAIMSGISIIFGLIGLVGHIFSLGWAIMVFMLEVCWLLIKAVFRVTGLLGKGLLRLFKR
jgi:hypothetical protein